MVFAVSLRHYPLSDSAARIDVLAQKEILLCTDEKSFPQRIDQHKMIFLLFRKCVVNLHSQ